MGVTKTFEEEIARLRTAGVPGNAGRLSDLFDWLAERGPEAPSASQAEIAEAVFGPGSSDADDATVRVYVHRLRKKIEDHYLANAPSGGKARVELPAGTYALRLISEKVPAERPPPRRWFALRDYPMWTWFAFALLGVGVLLVAGAALSLLRPNAIWQPLIQSDRPVLVVMGDYYIFGEIDPVRPEEGRLIRDFRVNSAQDLAALQDAEPQRYAMAEDQGLNYLPFASSYALLAVSPMLERADKVVEVIPASALKPDMLNQYDIIYIGLLSGMGLLEDVNFMNSSFRIGESYDELRDTRNGRLYVSGEARSLATPAFYRDYGYVARSVGPGGAQIVVLAGSRDTGLRGIASLATQRDLPEDMQPTTDAAFEGLVQVTGQQGADLSSRVLVARHTQPANEMSGH